MLRRSALVALFLLSFSATALADTPRGGVRAVVVDAADHPVSGATVILTTSKYSPLVIAGRTHADGGGQFRHLPPGSYQLLAIYGDARSVVRDIVVDDERTVDTRATLAVAPEVITIHEHQPPPSLPRAIRSSVSRLLPYSDEAIDTNAWAVAWLLLEIDARGEVTGFRFLHRPPAGLDAIAEKEAWKLRFEPARDAAGRAVPSELLWKMEWPSYWWYQAAFVSLPAPIPFQAAARRFSSSVRRGGFTLSGGVPAPPCRGSGPLHVGNPDEEYRDCSPPDFEQALTEPLVERQ